MTPRGSPRGVVCSRGRAQGRLSPGGEGRRGAGAGRTAPARGGMPLAVTLGEAGPRSLRHISEGSRPARRTPFRCWDGTSPSSLAGGEAGPHPGRGTRGSRPGRGGPAVSSRCCGDQPGKFPSELAFPRPAPGTPNEVNPLIENTAPSCCRPPAPADAAWPWEARPAPGRWARFGSLSTRLPAAALAAGRDPRRQTTLSLTHGNLGASAPFFNHLDCKVIRGRDIPKRKRSAAELSNSTVSTHLISGSPKNRGQVRFQ